jgi:hypothetical protein
MVNSLKIHGSLLTIDMIPKHAMQNRRSRNTLTHHATHCDPPLSAMHLWRMAGNQATRAS